MNIIFKLIFFTLFLNIASGILLYSLPDLPAAYASILSPISSQTEGQTELIEGMQGNITLPSTTASSENVKDILLDSFFIGKIIKFTGAIAQIAYGFPIMVYNAGLMFTPSDDPAAYLLFLNSFRGTLIFIVSISYALALFYLWTGKKIND